MCLLFLLMLRHPGCLNVDVLICSETSDPERLLLGEKNLIFNLKCFCLLLPCSLWKRRTFILHLSSFQAPLVFMLCGTNLLMDVWKHPSQHWKFWPVFHEHRSTCMQRRMWACCTSVSHPSHDGRALLWTSTPIFSQENLKLSCGHLYKLQVMKVCDSQYGSVMAKWVILLPLVYCGNPDCCHTIKPLVGSHNKLESCIKKGLIGESRKGVEKWAAGGGTGKDEKATVTRRAGWNGHHLQLMICP